jgi:small GTP-binding protein
MSTRRVRDTFDALLKLLLLGDSGVGKSSLLTQYVEDDFHDVFISTIGIDFRNKTLDVDGHRVKLRIWDTAGQERFRTLTAQFYRGSQGILMVYDVTSRETFENIGHWMKQIKDNVDTNPRIVIVGNKVDLPAERVVKKKEAEKLAKSYGCQHFEVSAKADDGVKEAFQALAVEVVNYHYKKKKGVDGGGGGKKGSRGKGGGGPKLENSQTRAEDARRAERRRGGGSKNVSLEQRIGEKCCV